MAESLVIRLGAEANGLASWIAVVDADGIVWAEGFGTTARQGGRPVDAEIGFDPVDQDPAKDIRPAVVSGNPNAGLRRKLGEPIAAATTADSRDEVDRGKVLESLGDC